MRISCVVPLLIVKEGKMNTKHGITDGEKTDEMKI